MLISEQLRLWPSFEGLFYVLVNMYLVKVVSADLAFNKGLAGADIFFNGVYAVIGSVNGPPDIIQSIVNTSQLVLYSFILFNM